MGFLCDYNHWLQIEKRLKKLWLSDNKLICNIILYCRTIILLSEHYSDFQISQVICGFLTTPHSHMMTQCESKQVFFSQLFSPFLPFQSQPQGKHDSCEQHCMTSVKSLQQPRWNILIWWKCCAGGTIISANSTRRCLLHGNQLFLIMAKLSHEGKSKSKVYKRKSFFIFLLFVVFVLTPCKSA